jgi:hypothetical protein
MSLLPIKLPSKMLSERNKNFFEDAARCIFDRCQMLLSLKTETADWQNFRGRPSGTQSNGVKMTEL